MKGFSPFNLAKQRALCSAIPNELIVGFYEPLHFIGAFAVMFYDPFKHSQNSICRQIASAHWTINAVQPSNGRIFDTVLHYPHLSLNQLSWTIMTLRLKSKITNNTKFVYFQTQNISALEKLRSSGKIDLMKKSAPEMVGLRLKSLRDLKGVSQREVCTLLEIAPQRYNHYEKGRARPDPDVLAKFMQYYGVTSDYLLFGNVVGLRFEVAQELLEENSSKPMFSLVQK